jgi:glycosyltransferase involved in cell wall biosynthesis
MARSPHWISRLAERMRVAHLTTVDSSLRFLLFPQLKAVIDEGGTAIGISAPGPWVEGLERDGIRHIALSASTRGIDPVADFKTVWQLWRVLRTERPDVLHTHNPKPGLYGRVLGRVVRVPIVVNTVHGLYATETDRWSKRLVVYLLEAIASRFSDAELMQNPEDLELMRRWRITPRRRSRLLGNGVDLVRFSPDRFTAADRARLRQSLGIDSQDIVVGIVARLVTEKGYLELFDAMRRLGAEYRLLAVGPPDPEKADALPHTALAAAEQSGALFLGQRDDVEALYATMDVFVLPSHREGYPRGPMEAAAMGVPVVATDIRGCRQVVEHEVNGLLVPLRDVGALTDAIRRIAEDPELRSRMGRAGRRIAQERFDERRCVEIVLDTYREVARRKGTTTAVKRHRSAR